MRCAYTGSDDPSLYVNLNTIGAVDFSGTTLEDLYREHPTIADQFSQERTRVSSELAAKYGSIDESTRRDDAFKALQDAQNAADEEPNAYQAARVNYYTLVFGEEWKEKEKARVAKAEVDPVVKNYKNSYKDLKTRLDSQRTTIDVVDNLKDNVLTLKDDFQYSVDTFTDQLEKLQTQINMDRRSREKPSDKDDPWKWIDTVLNMLIVIGILAAIVIAYSRWSKHARATQGTYMVRPAV